MSDNRDCYMLVYNIGKRKNFGDILRSAAAFGVNEVFVVGAKKLSLFGNQGTQRYCRFSHFESLDDAKAELKRRGIRLVGIEINHEATPVHQFLFDGATCFMAGNEGSGMNEQQLAACDSFVYIPQYSGATASLNVATATGIVLHHFALWSGKPEQDRQDHKFVVDQPPSYHLNPTEELLREADLIREARRHKQEASALSNSE